MTFLGLF